MTRTLLRGVVLAVLAGGLAAPASAGELKLTMQNGRVTLIADNVPVRQILQEWQRIGQTQIVNIDKLGGGNLTLQIVDAPEHDALDIVLRSANGYIAAPRSTPIAGAAVYDRITIFVSAVKAPAQVASAAPPPTFQRPPQPDDSDEPINVAMPPQIPGQTPGMPPQLPPQLQQLQQLQQNLQQQNQGLAAPGNSPLTAPRPGALPQPSVPGGVPNPYQPVPIKPGGGGA